MWKKSLHSFKQPRVITMCAVMLAIACALDFVNPLNIGPTIRVGFKFVFMAIGGYIAGPVPAMLLSAAGDIIGYILKPAGAYFFGYTLTAAVKGLLYGIFLYKYGRAYLKSNIADTVLKCVLAEFFINTIANIGLNSLWLSMTVGNVTYDLLWARILKNALMFPIEVVIMIVALLLFRKTETALKMRL